MPQTAQTKIEPGVEVPDNFRHRHGCPEEGKTRSIRVERFDQLGRSRGASKQAPPTEPFECIRCVECGAGMSIHKTTGEMIQSG